MPDGTSPYGTRQCLGSTYISLTLNWHPTTVAVFAIVMRSIMDVLYPCCAGVDVHKKMVVVCVCTSTTTALPHKEVRTYSTMTADLLALSAG